MPKSTPTKRKKPSKLVAHDKTKLTNMIQACADTNELSEWELSFINHLANTVSERDLSTKEYSKLKEIHKHKVEDAND